MSPRAPLKPCTYPGGCPRLVESGRCEVHRRQVYREQNARRDPADLAFYGSARWKRFRLWFANGHPTCECADTRCRCGGSCNQPMSDVDHIETPGARPDLALAEENCRALCRSCHSARTARDQSFGKARP